MPVYETTMPVYTLHPRGPFTGMIVKIEEQPNEYDASKPRLMWRLESDLVNEKTDRNFTLVKFTSTSRHAKSSLPPWIRKLGGEAAWQHVLAHGLDTDEFEGLRVKGYVSHAVMEDGKVRDEITDIELVDNPWADAAAAPPPAAQRAPRIQPAKAPEPVDPDDPFLNE